MTVKKACNGWPSGLLKSCDKNPHQVRAKIYKKRLRWGE